MRKRTIVVFLVLTILLIGVLPALAAANLTAALGYLKSQQNADGGFGSGFSPDSSLGSTSDVVLAIVAAGGDPAAFDQGGKTPLTYLAANAAKASTGGDLAKLILAATAVGENPRRFGGTDSVAKLEALITRGGKIGTETDTFVAHCLAVLALKSTRRPIPAAAVEYIKAAQQDSGGWAWDGSASTDADTNSTAFAVQALIAAGEPASSQTVTKALAYYKAIQNADGGWPYQNPSAYGTDTDANSTAVVIQALIAAGQNPAGADWTKEGGNTPIAALTAMQNESGAFRWQASFPDDNLLATIQALPALAGKAFPLTTMEVGEAVVAAPITTPQTGGAVANLAWPLLLGGSALVGGGLALRRKK